MYQFIVTTRSSGNCVGTGNSSWSGAGATVGDISTMALAGNGTNKWASRAVVALQLAAWSAVGIVLLEKGVSSLQKSPHTPLNVSQEVTTPLSPSNPPDSKIQDDPKNLERLSDNESNPLSVIPINGVDSNTPKSELKKFENQNSSWDRVKKHPMPESEEPRNLDSVDKPAISPQQQLERTNTNLFNDETIKNEELIRLNDSVDKNSEKKTIFIGRFVAPNYSNSDDDRGEQGKVEKQNEQTASVAGISQERIWNNPVTIKVLMANFEEHRWATRKRLRVARVNTGGGAAAAVAMVAVGAIMLILGPAVIILRALDERRQERRFLKLSGEEDLPPSYEEATSELDQAPTYSSLNLDTLVVAPTSSNSNGSEENTCLTSNCRRDSFCC